jgi:hypothetical protein
MSEQMQSEIAQLSGQLDQIEDPREGYALVQDRIRTYRSMGDQVPDALSLAQSQGR